MKICTDKFRRAVTDIGLALIVIAGLLLFVFVDLVMHYGRDTVLGWLGF